MNEKTTEKIIENFDFFPNLNSKKNNISKNNDELYINKDFAILNGDSVSLIKKIPDDSIKLFYGSPPYPNAQRNYKTWKIENYIEEISPFIENIIPKLKKDGFIVINVKSNRTKPKNKNVSSERSLIIEELMLHMKKTLNLFCVDIEIWIKSNPVPNGIKSACIDAYEYNLWFSKSEKWKINIDSIRKKYSNSSIKSYETSVYKPRANGLQYVSKEKRITPHPKGALATNVTINEFSKLLLDSLPQDVKKQLNKKHLYSLINEKYNVAYGSVSAKSVNHQAVQPEYLPEKYILACTSEGDIVLDPWSGSGTTGVAALKNNRRYIGIDISKEFAELSELTIMKSLKDNLNKKNNKDNLNKNINIS